MTKELTSHELATRLFNTARLLFMKEDVALPGVEDTTRIEAHFYDREPFLDAVRAMGAGTKKFDNYDFSFTPNDTILTLRVQRSKVCKRIQEEKWECEPLLTPEQFGVKSE